MSGKGAMNTHQRGVKTLQDAPIVHDLRHELLALVLQFGKRCLETANLEELYLILTNDIRAVIQFDRSFLVVHVGSKSHLVSASNQPILGKKSRFAELANALGEALRDVHRGVLLATEKGLEGVSEDDLPASARESVLAYLNFSKSDYLFCVPLMRFGVPEGHLVLEFFSGNVPDQLRIAALLNVAPFIASALAEAKQLSRKPYLRNLFGVRDGLALRSTTLKKYSRVAAVPVVLFCLFFFVIPFPFKVGGEAEVVPTGRQFAFCKMEGLLEQVYVTEGARVEKGQILAALDGKESDFKIKSSEKQFQILTNEMVVLQAAANENVAKLAESKLVELKRQAAWEELSYHKWQTQFLRITSPTAGVVATKDVESLVGKKLAAGEPFCEIVVPGNISVDLFIPQDRVTFVKKGQAVSVHLDSDPWRGYQLFVHEIAPTPDVIPRLGNVYRVRAPLPEASGTTLLGMKGVGSIQVTDASLYYILSQRIITLWNRWLVGF